MCAADDRPGRGDEEGLLQATAFHEAGHALVAYLCGQRLSRLEIHGDEGLSGACHALRVPPSPPLDASTPAGRAAVEELILCTCAGPLAEARLTGGDWDESSSDLDAAVRLALQLEDDCDAAMQRLEALRRRLDELLGQHWAAVEAVARLLLRRRSVSGEAVEALLDGVVDPARVAAGPGRVDADGRT